jgi:hypothetical protein
MAALFCGIWSACCRQINLQVSNSLGCLPGADQLALSLIGLPSGVNEAGLLLTADIDFGARHIMMDRLNSGPTGSRCSTKLPAGP